MNNSNYVISKILKRHDLIHEAFIENSTLIIVEARFDIIKRIQTVYSEYSFPVLRVKNTKNEIKTREILFQILEGLLGNVKNPRKTYGTDLKTITETIKNLFPRGINILSYYVHPKAAERLLSLEIPISIIIQPTNNKIELKALASKYPTQVKIIKIRDDIGALEHYARFILPFLFKANTGTNRRLNPWHPLMPHQVAELLDLSQGNVLFFSYLLSDIKSSASFKNSLKFALKEYIENELESFEIEILRKVSLNKISEINLMNTFASISKTKLRDTLRELFMLNLLKKTTDYSNKMIYYELNPTLSKIFCEDNNEP